MKTKICSKCKKEKDLNDFHKKSSTKCGVRSICKACRVGEYWTETIQIQQKRYQKNNKEKIKERQKKRYIKNRMKILRKQSESYYKNWEINKEKRRISSRKSYNGRIEYQKKYRLENKKNIRKKSNEAKRKRYNSDPCFKLRERISSLFRIQITQFNIKKNKELFKYTGFKRIDYINHFKETEEWNNFLKNKNLDIDHIIPVSEYDFNDVEDIKKCWNPKNLRLLDRYENRNLKRNKIDFKLIKKHKIENLLPGKYKKC